MKQMAEKSFLLPLPPKSPLSKVIAKASERRGKGLPVVDFSSGNVGRLPYNMKLFSKIEIQINEEINDSLKLIAEALKRGILESYSPNPNGLSYSPTGGTLPIKEQVIRYFREIHGVPLKDTDYDRVIVTAGGQQALSASFQSLRPGTKVLLTRWDYAPVTGMIKAQGCDEVRVNSNEDLSIDRDDFNSKLEEGAVFYMSMPNNPTGYVSSSDLEFAASKVHEMGGGLIWDAPYIFTILRLTPSKAYYDRSLLVEEHNKFKKIAEKYFDDMCILSSLSKTCLIAGLRFGFATANPHWIGIMDSIIGRENLSSPTSSFIIGGNTLKMFLDNPITHEWLCEVLAERLTVLIEEGLPLILPKNGMFGALYALVKTPGVEGSEFADKLVDEYGIVCVSGSAFYGGPTNAIRLSLVATPWVEGDEEWRRNVKALKKALGI